MTFYLISTFISKCLTYFATGIYGHHHLQVAAAVSTAVSPSGKVKDDEKYGTCSTQWREVKSLKFCCQKSVRKTRFGEPERRREDSIKMGLKNYCVMMCSGFIWLRIGSYGWLLRIR
jgi:hypothetical protein